MNRPSILVVSAFEAELQPIAAASAVAALRAAPADVAAWDAHVFPEDRPDGRFDVALLSVQQFEGIERALELAVDIRRRDLARTIVAFGQYAQLNAAALLEHVDAVALDEPERLVEALVGIAAGAEDALRAPGFATRAGSQPRPRRATPTWWAPFRPAFRSLVHYPAHHTQHGLMGNVELSRGCHHRCTYCSVYGAYDGRVARIATDAVVDDARQLAEDGVRHFAFIDAEFFNSRRLGIEAMQRIARDIWPCSFEFTTRIDHIITNRAEIEQLVALGLKKITSALEFPSNRILRIFDKGIDVDDMRAAIAIAEDVGVTLNPTFIPFTPWVTYDELRGFEDFLVDTRLARVVDPTALQTRLLLFKGSPLLASPWIDGIPLVDRGFYYEWEHPDPRVEELWRSRRVEAEGAGKVRCCVKC